MVKSPKNGADSEDEIRERVRQEKQLLRESPVLERPQEDLQPSMTMDNQGEGETNARKRRKKESLSEEEVLKLRSLLESGGGSNREADAPRPSEQVITRNSSYVLDIEAGIRNLGLGNSALIYPEPKQVRHFMSCVSEYEKSLGVKNIFIAPLVSQPIWWSDEDRLRIGIDTKAACENGSSTDVLQRLKS